MSDSQPRPWIVMLIAAVSGAVALGYELLFFRRLALIFGVAELAAALCVGVFLLGLGVGAWLAGRRGHSSTPLRAYAWAELGLAGCGVLSPWAFEHLGRASLLWVFVPAVLMGASFPWLARSSYTNEQPHSRRIGWVYGCNTLGAACGVLSFGFWILPNVGLERSTWVAASANLILAASAALAARQQRLSAAPAREPSIRTSIPRFVIGSAAGIGALSIALQVFATRILGSLLAGTVYTLSSILFVFLVGLGLGAIVGGWWMSRSADPRRSLAWIALSCAPALLVSLWALRWVCGGEDLLAGVIQMGLYEPGTRIQELPASAWFALCVKHAAWLLLLPTMCLGAFLPACTHWIAKTAPERSLGALYLWNSLGALGGGLLAAHLGLGQLGLRASFAVWLALLLGAVLLLQRKLLPGVLLSAGLGVLTLWPGPSPGTSRGLETLFYQESVASSAKVESVRDAAESAPVRILRVNGKPVASSIFIDRRLQYLLGSISSLTHQQPRSALCIGLGTGMSAHALAAGTERLTVVELSRAVLAAQPYFASWNGQLLERSDTRWILDDGRAFLQRSAERFDVISADPIDPCVAGSAYLYTQEYYQLARSRLNAGGSMTQWIPLYDLAFADIASIAGTFQSVFPHTSAWVTGYDLVLLGTLEPLNLELKALEARMRQPELAQLLADVGVHTADDLLACYFAGPKSVAELAAQAPFLNTDDAPWIEFHAPLANFGSYPVEVYRYLALCADPLPLASDSAEHRVAEIQGRRRRLQAAAWDFARELEASSAWGQARNNYIQVLRGR